MFTSCGSLIKSNKKINKKAKCFARCKFDLHRCRRYQFERSSTNHHGFGFCISIGEHAAIGTKQLSTRWSRWESRNRLGRERTNSISSKSRSRHMLSSHFVYLYRIAPRLNKSQNHFRISASMLQPQWWGKWEKWKTSLQHWFLPVTNYKSR